VSEFQPFLPGLIVLLPLLGFAANGVLALMHGRSSADAVRGLSGAPCAVSFAVTFRPPFTAFISCCSGTAWPSTLVTKFTKLGAIPLGILSGLS
jgi:hypothetical protein